MKSIDIFCASPASTAICSSMDHRSMVRTIDRHMHRGGSPRPRSNAAPCSSHLPFDPSRRPLRKPQASEKHTEPLRRKSSADATEGLSAGSARRHLLTDTPFFDIVTDPERGLVSGQAYTIRDRYGDNKVYERMNLDGIKGGFRSLSTNSSTPRNPAVRLKDHLNAQKPPSKHPHHQQQVVELWVSIHCKGCEGKLRKHISRMEGVTSFSIDLGTKKVTVVGDVTPVGVLSSISKVKNAQFWPSPAPTATSSSSSASTPRVSLAR